MGKDIIKQKALQSALLGVVSTIVYIGLVATLMVNGDKLFGQMDGFLGPMMFLMLFVLSALIVGLSLLGRPIYLFMTGMKKESLLVLGYTVLLFFILTVLGFGIFAISRA